MTQISAPPWQTAWIVGGSTGIGRDITIKLAALGVKVAVSSRSVDKLAELAAAHENVIAFPVDITDDTAVASAYSQIVEQVGSIDLAVLNAGVWHPMSVGEFDVGRCRQSMEVNHGGITNTLQVLLPDMLAADSGHIGLVASVAGYRGLPKAIAYAPSKAAVISLAEVLKLELESTNVDVSLINPGFVDTPMTSVNDFPMPYIISSDDAAERIIKGLKRRRFEIAFPWQLVWTLKFLRILPYSWYFTLARRMTREE
ncbi:MAG: SDR family NAD(P)-dependent oxidoreductase [Pseudomonadota bacterium]